jgi:hypothetical protein
LQIRTRVLSTGYGGADTSSLHPLDGALNLPPEKYALEVRRRVAIEAAQSSFEEGVKTLDEEWEDTSRRWHSGFRPPTQESPPVKKAA